MSQGDGESLRGKVVLVTGSGRGLGSALVRSAADRRARVVINCQTNQKCAEGLALDIQKAGGEAMVCRADVTDHEQARGLVDETLRAFGRLDILINTVGTFTWKPVADMEPDEWRDVLASNLDSVFHMSRLALPHMRRHHWGRIVNVGSVGAERTFGQPRVAAYSAAKAAVVAFSKALALEEARCGITVNVVSPGVLENGEVDTNGEGLLGDRVPAGRPCTVDDVIRSVFFFLSPQADFVTGQVLSVAGGWRL